MSRPRILDEDKRTLEEARPEFGTDGNPADFSTVYNAVTKGCALPDGGKEYLEAVRLGGRWITSKQAIERFVVALTEAWSGRAPGSAEIATRRQRRQHDEATRKRLAEVDAQLVALG